MFAHPVSAVRRLETCKILLDQSSIKDVRFSISSLLWADQPFYSGIKGTRQKGTFRQWGNASQLIPYIDWDDGETDTRVTIH